jgi:hypothetical protein
MNISTAQYEDAFYTGQQIFDGRIEEKNYGSQVAQAPNDEARELLTDGSEQQGFVDLGMSSKDIYRHKSLLVGRIMLIGNRDTNEFSPVIITEDYESGPLSLTRLNQPFVPSVGASEGIRFGLSVKAQSRVQGFGGHGNTGGFETGHFATAQSAASQNGQAIANALKESGDKATHKVLEAGVPETMSRLGILPISYTTVLLERTNQHPLQLVWHRGLDTDNGPIAGDYPEATKLMLGAGFKGLGEQAIVRLERLVSEVVRGSDT